MNQRWYDFVQREFLPMKSSALFRPCDLVVNIDLKCVSLIKVRRRQVGVQTIIVPTQLASSVGWIAVSNGERNNATISLHLGIVH